MEPVSLYCLRKLYIYRDNSYSRGFKFSYLVKTRFSARLSSLAVRQFIDHSTHGIIQFFVAFSLLKNVIDVLMKVG